MNGLRFKVGELARIAVCPNGNFGKICEIDVVGPIWFRPHDDGDKLVCADYRIVIDGRGDWFAYDYELQKLDPPAEPKTMTVVEEVEV